MKPRYSLAATKLDWKRNTMAGKLEFPESLPPPPSPPCTLLLGPTDFSFPVEKCSSFDSTSNSSCDTTSLRLT
ncbi:hypothetical protein E2C01_035559 [Portunus trituberculatus]|uniref:Uncharacterized protein n=1 Tax=Portunus trituberculatus TaxID=210409 RepID=A0A5B7F9N6_PORTR|nr:hypothetical protein [Portunus trituberculatus]